MDQLQKLVKRTVESGYESESLLTQMSVVVKEFSNMISKHEKLDETLEELNLSNMWTTCSCCGSPVLLSYMNCPYCEETLLGDDKPAEAKEEKVEKKTTKKKAAKKAEPVVEETEEEAEPEPEPEVEEEQKVAETKEADDDDLPSEAEVNKMRTPGLKKLIKELELDVDADDYDSAKDLKKAVNSAIDALAEGGEEEEDGSEFEEDSEEEDLVDSDDEEGEESEEEEVEEEASDAEVEGFDLDDFEDDDEDDEVFNEE